MFLGNFFFSQINLSFSGGPNMLPSSEGGKINNANLVFHILQENDPWYIFAPNHTKIWCTGFNLGKLLKLFGKHELGTCYIWNSFNNHMQLDKYIKGGSYPSKQAVIHILWAHVLFGYEMMQYCTTTYISYHENYCCISDFKRSSH